LSTSIVVDPEQILAAEKQAVAEVESLNRGEAPAAPTQPQQAPTESQLTEDDVPEKYRGKSLKDIIAMHQNAESELGRKNNEVGVIRKLADELIGVRAIERSREQANQPKPEPLTADRLLESPEEAILAVVKRTSEDKTVALESKVASLEERLLTEEFEKRHPGFQETMTKPEFGSWLQTSAYRQRLGLAAAQGDFSAADELFGLYEEYNAAKGATPQQTETAKPNTPSARQATLARSGGSAAGGVVPSSDGKKFFTRAELMDMRINRPEEFDMRQDEILTAYREKRVR
jgi:hypothetical protein